MTSFEFVLTGSLEKVMPKSAPKAECLDRKVLFQNQRWSFQLAYLCRNDDQRQTPTDFSVRCTGDAASAAVLRCVQLVPCEYPCHGTWDDRYLTTAPGLLPDLLRPAAWGETLRGVPAQWRSLWITVDAAALPPGGHELFLEAYGPGEELLERFAVVLHVLDKALPPQTLYHTEWFHADCLADYYHVKVFSEEHWKIIENFIAGAAAHSVNMLLTPVFTPPLDTFEGGERTPIQLVDIVWDGKEYRFDFSRLRRWVMICREHRITEIEVAHLFTQWGANCAPNIWVNTPDGPEKRFGWHTPAVGGEYTVFLRAFLPELKLELDRLVGLSHVWFHISDEPSVQDKQSYLAAKASVEDFLSGCHIIDALSDYSFYREEIVKQPVVSCDHLQTFADHHVSGLWTYYCTAQALQVPNRFIAMPSTRNRVLGVLLYLYEISGFLHWGFNFYNVRGSLHPIEPFRVTDAGLAFPSGDAFLVYPGENGEAWESIRGEVLKEALQDLRLLRLAEETVGRQRVLNLLGELFQDMSFINYPGDKSFFEALWNGCGELCYPSIPWSDTFPTENTSRKTKGM